MLREWQTRVLGQAAGYVWERGEPFYGASARTLHPTIPRASGESPVRLWRKERAVGDAVSPIPPKATKNKEVHKWLGGSGLCDKHGRYTGFIEPRYGPTQDAAFNEDTGEQPHNIKLQEALLGLNVRQPRSLALWRLLDFECPAWSPKVGGVSSSNYRVRRATLDNIRQLTALWHSMQFPVEDLARRITEFQVAEGADGEVLGAVGLQIAERQGLVHSEAFSDFALADHLRPLLWDRLHVVATNHGLLRIWTREQAPFWNHCGLLKADAEALQKLPALWRGPSSAWLTLKLKDDVETVMSLDKEFAQFMQSEKQRTERVFQRARRLKTVMTLIAFVLLIAVGVWAARLFMRNPQLLRH